MNRKPSSQDVIHYGAHGEQDTERLGRLLAEELAAGTVVALIGELGAGKTRLVQAVAEDLGVDRRQVTSPTFILIQEYEGRLPVYHLDAYRLKNAAELLDLGADEILGADGVCLIEWADRVADVLPDDLLRIEIAVTGPTSREFQMTATGPKSAHLLAKLQTRLPP